MNSNPSFSTMNQMKNTRDLSEEPVDDLPANKRQRSDGPSGPGPSLSGSPFGSIASKSESLFNSAPSTFTFRCTTPASQQLSPTFGSSLFRRATSGSSLGLFGSGNVPPASEQSNPIPSTTSSGSLFSSIKNNNVPSQTIAFGTSASSSVFGGAVIFAKESAAETDTSTSTPAADSHNQLTVERNPVTSTAPASFTLFGAQPSVTGASASFSLFRGREETSEQDVTDSGQDSESERSFVEDKGAQQENPTIKQEARLGSPENDTKPETEQASAPKPAELLDPRGDLILVAGQEGVTFRVCSRALARSSPVWETMLYGPFSEGKDQQNSNDWTILLPEDNPEALRIILKAVHSRLDTMPAFLLPEILFEVTLLCDKYDVVGLLKSFWHHWVAALPPARREPSGFVHRLWIARTLGYLEYYKSTLVEFMCLLKRVNGVYCLVDCNGEDLAENTHLNNLGLMRHLRHGRKVLMGEAFALLKQGMDDLTMPENGTPLCKSPGNSDWQQICDLSMLGALHRNIHGLCWDQVRAEGRDGAGKPGNTVPQIVQSIEQLRQRIIETTLVASRRGGHHHKECTPWKPIVLGEILTSSKAWELIPVDEEHFKKQREKSGAIMVRSVFGSPTRIQGPTPAFFEAGIYCRPQLF